MVLGVISGWCRFSGEKQGSCARSMDVIPAGMGDAETLPEEQLGPMAMPMSHPSVPQKHPGQEVQCTAPGHSAPAG